MIGKMLKTFALAIVVAMVNIVAVAGNVAKVGNTEYATIDEAIANWTNGSTLTLLDEDAAMAIDKHGEANVTIWKKPAVTIPETLTGTVVEEIKNNTALKDYTPENLPQNAELEIELKSVGETIVYDVTPMANGAEVEPTEAITFRLPVPASVPAVYAKVLHEEKNIGIFEIKGEGNAKYVEISSADFAKFTVVPIALSTNNYDLAGEGTADSPYQINNLTELEFFRDSVNAGNNYAGKVVQLTADIDLGNKEWTPIAYMGKTFTGTFDGNGKTIKNLKITKELANAAANNGIGFFGRTDSSAVIKNLTIENVDITGSLYVGAVVGYGYTGNAVENCTVKGDISIDAWWYAGVIGGNGYMNTIKNCRVFGNDGSYIKGNNGSYIGGIWGFRGEGANNIVDCSVENLEIIGVDRVGGIAGIGHYSNTVSGCSVNKVTITATDPDATTVGLIVGACQGTTSEPSVFVNNAINETVARVDNGDGTFKNVACIYGTNINGSTPVTNFEASINGIAYETLKASAAAAQAGDEIVLLLDATLSAQLTLPAGISINGNGKSITGAEVWADGNLTFVGHTKMQMFNAGYNKPTITIGAGACLELTGSGRMVIGHGATFNITGTIVDAKTADKATLTPSLIMPGASFTGAGVTFNVQNAYIKAPSSYCSSSKSASGTFDFNVQNSIIETAGKLAFEEQSTAATVNFELKDSVLTTGSHLIFGVSKGEVVIDNSNVNVGTSRQIENCSTMIVKNGSVVNGAVATSSNAKNPGTVVVENATYAVTGEFSGSDLGTGTVIVKKGATFSAGSITKANITIDATDMTEGELANFTANLSKFAGTLTVVNNDKLEASIVDGKIVLAKKPVAKIGDVTYETLQAAVNAVQNGETVTLVADITENVTLTEKTGLYYTIDGNGKKMEGTITISSLSDTNDNRRITIKNINFVTTTGRDFITSTATNHYPRVTVEGCSFAGTGNADTVAIRLKSSHSVIIKDCSGTGLHSFLQNTSGWNLTVANVTVTDSKSGLALGTVQGVTVEGCEMTVAGYGIRLDAGYNNNAVLENNKITAFIPVVVRKASVDSNITVKGDNTMTATNTDDIWFAIGTSEYETNGTMPTAATGKVRVSVNDAGLNKAGVYGAYKEGSNSPAYTAKDDNGNVRVWGEGGGNATYSYVLKLFSGENLIATSTLNNVGGILNGNVFVTWAFFYPASNDEYWTTVWVEGHPNSAAQPTKVELWIDGVMVSSTPAQMNGPDNLNPIVWRELGGVAVGDLEGEGTEAAPYLIKNLAELKYFRDSVNAGNNYAGKYVALAADIDLGNEDWAPIGFFTDNKDASDDKPFKGVFDGQGKTISNLKIDKPEMNAVGFFAYAESAFIKNLNVVNAEITGYSQVAAIVGRPYSGCSIANCHVSGTIAITAKYAYAGGIAGYGYLVVENCSVVGADTKGTITAVDRNAVGGITAWLLEGVSKMTNCHVKNMTLTGWTNVGGLTGFLHYNGVIDGCSVENVVLTKTRENGHPGIGWAAGGWSYNASKSAIVKNSTFKNMTRNGQAVYISSADVMFGSEYAGNKNQSLKKDNNTLEAVEDNLWLIVSNYEDLVSALARSDAKVRLANDITAAATESSGYGKAGIVLNAGNILDGAGYTLKITGAGATWDCAIAMRGGEVRNLTIDGAMRGVFMPGANGDVVIDNCVFKNVVYTFNSDAGSKDYAVTIKNSTLNGWTSFSNVHKSVDFVNCSFGKGSGYAYCRPYQATTFTGCTFAEGYEFDTSKAEANALSFNNCTYAGNAVSAKDSAALFSLKGEVLINGTSVNFASAVAKIGSAYYYTLTDAVAAAQAGDTIVLLADIEATSYIALGKSLTINGNGHKVTSSATRVFRVTTSNVEVILTDVNMVSTAVRVGQNDVRGISVDASLNGVKLTLNNCSVDFTDASACDWSYAVNIAGSGTGHALTVNGGTYEGANVINVNGTRNNIIVKDATLTSLYPINEAYYGAAIYVAQDTDSSIEATGNTFNGGNAVGINAGYTPVTESNNTDNMTRVVAKIGTALYTDLRTAMTSAKAGETVVMIADVDLSGKEWEPVSFAGKFNGNGKTIRNLTINKPGVSNVGFISSLNSTFENVTFENPTVTGGESTGVVAGRAGGSSALAQDITITGTIKVETTHSGYARAAAIVGGWGYGNYKNITVDGIDAAVSYIKHTGGGDGRYVAGIVGHADEVQSFENCIVKNITISGGWLCGGITGPGPGSATVSGCAVENIKMNADYSGGMFGWYYGSGAVENSSVKNVEFIAGGSRNGAIGGYGVNADANLSNVTFENVTNFEGKPLLEHVASVNGVYYTSLKSAVDAAQDGDTVTLLADVVIDSTITISKSITIEGNSEKITTSADFVGNGSNAMIDITENTSFSNVKFEGIKKVAVMRSVSADIVIDGCVIKDCDQDVAQGLIRLACCNATITDSQFINNDCTMVVSFGYDAANDTDVLLIDGCLFEGNTCSETAVVYFADGDYGKVTDTVFVSNVVNATGNAATLYMGWGDGFEVSGCTFKDNTVVTSSATTKRFASAIFCDGCIVKGNAFIGNTATRNGETIATIVAVGAYYGAADVSANYWGKANPESVDFTIEYTRNDVAFDSYYTSIDEDGKLVNLVTFAAKIGNTKYPTLQSAVNAAQEGDTVQLLAVEISEGTVKLPETLKNVTIKGVEGAVLKDMTISAADGNSYNYVGLTFDGLTFDNSRLLFTGWRNGDEVIEDLTIVNCVFSNLYDNTNTAPVHINKDAAEAVKNFTFRNNVIDGATGGSKSGIYLQATGNVIIENNVINNVSFRPYVIQITTDDGIADNFVVSGNTFSGSAAGRAQGLGNNDAGTDTVVLKVNNNIFKGITDAQQICYWNFNAETTTADLSKNYYDIDIVANPSKIYYNSAAADTVDLIEKGVYPYYTELNADGTINVDSLVQAPAIVAQIGNKKFISLQDAFTAAQEGDTITMIADEVLAATVKITADKTITLDLNGKTIDGTGKVRIAIMSYGNLTIKDSVGNGVVKAGIDAAGNCINICGGSFTLESGNIYSLNNAILIDEQAAEVTIMGGKITAEPSTRNSAAFYISSTSDTLVNITGGEIVGYNGILLWNNTTLNITGGSIEAKGSVAIQGNGSKDNTVISISGDAELSGYYAAIYHPQGGKLSISENAKLTGWTGVVVKGGDVTISGGTITGTGAANAYAPASSGFVDTGDALYVEHYDNSANSENYGTPVVKVTGGTFISTNGKAVASYKNPNNNVEALDDFITGGTFSTDVTELCSFGYYSWNDNSAYTVVKPSVWMVNGAASNENIVNDIDSKVVGAVTISKEGDNYVANAACVFKVLAVDTVNPENSPYSLTDGNGNTLKLRTGVQVKAKYVDSLTNDTTKIFKLVIE